MSGTRYTFKENRNLGRHGWLRLTPAYSVSLVDELVQGLGADDLVLDPFCGTGTTALVCAERGIPCVTTDINPFLVWFATAKTRQYVEGSISSALASVDAIERRMQNADAWIPPMRYIERWWDADTLIQLGKLRHAIWESEESDISSDLVKIAFCQTLMERSLANFRHQSISLKSDISHEHLNSTTAQTTVFSSFRASLESIAAQTTSRELIEVPEVHLHDARLSFSNDARKFSAVITSPPYANRMSYIRELRPYMYWLEFLESGSQAGALDWEAIGGTWGSATSKLIKWESGISPIKDGTTLSAIDVIESQSLVLGRYIRKYIEDTAVHLKAIRPSLAPGASVTYIVGNSRFYDSLLDTERIYAELFESNGLLDVQIRTLRKRTSKRELFEFAVSGRAPD